MKGSDAQGERGSGPTSAPRDAGDARPVPPLRPFLFGSIPYMPLKIITIPYMTLAPHVIDTKKIPHVSFSGIQEMSYIFQWHSGN